MSADRLLHRWHHALSGDPGVSTGFVLADWPVDALGVKSTAWESVVWTGATVADSHLRGWLHERGTRFVRECQFRGEPLTVLLERPPQRAREPGGAFRVIQEWLGEVGCVVEVVQASPGEWKPWVRANPLSRTTKTGNQHERDALNLLRWWLATKRG